MHDRVCIFSGQGVTIIRLADAQQHLLKVRGKGFRGEGQRERV